MYTLHFYSVFHSFTNLLHRHRGHATSPSTWAQEGERTAPPRPPRAEQGQSGGPRRQQPPASREPPAGACRGRGACTRVSPGSSPRDCVEPVVALGPHTLALSSWTVPLSTSLVPQLVWGVFVKTHDDPDGLETWQLGKICHRK